MNTILPAELYALMEKQPVDLIDVRRVEEFQEVHARGAVNFPLDDLDPAAVARARKAAGQPLYFICRSGGRSGRACEQFENAGITDVVNVEGGTLAWQEANLPVG